MHANAQRALQRYRQYYEKAYNKYRPKMDVKEEKSNQPRSIVIDVRIPGKLEWKIFRWDRLKILHDSNSFTDWEKLRQKARNEIKSKNFFKIEKTDEELQSEEQMTM